MADILDVWLDVSQALAIVNFKICCTDGSARGTIARHKLRRIRFHLQEQEREERPFFLPFGVGLSIQDLPMPEAYEADWGDQEQREVILWA